MTIWLQQGTQDLESVLCPSQFWFTRALSHQSVLVSEVREEITSLPLLSLREA